VTTEFEVRAGSGLAVGSETSGRAGGPASVPKLVVSDLDGTFLSPDGTVSPTNAAAVRAAEAAGLPVLFATGRPVRWLDVIRGLPGAHPTVIASNGAVLFDLGEGRMLDRICIDPAVALQAVADIRRAAPGAAFSFESGTTFGYEAAYRLRVVDDGSDPVLVRGEVEALAAKGDAVKMLVQHLQMSSDDLLERVRDAVADTLTVTHSAGLAHGLVEVSAPGVSKASMLQRICAGLGLQAADVAAFGDMPNDLDMLTWVGRPHVVANAHPRLLGLGYTEVPGNGESGVGHTILGWLQQDWDV